MAFVEKIRLFIERLEKRDFYLYLAGIIGGCLLLVGLLVFQYYRKIGQLHEQVESVNEMREEARLLLVAQKKIKEQHRQIDTLLAQDVGFKIRGYFDTVLSKLNLTGKESEVSTSHIDHANNYRENILKARLTDIDMRQLTEFLQEIEQSKRVYTKELEIIRSKKKVRSLDVNLTIATLEPTQT